MKKCYSLGEMSGKYGIPCRNSVIVATSGWTLAWSRIGPYRLTTSIFVQLNVHFFLAVNISSDNLVRFQKTWIDIDNDEPPDNHDNIIFVLFLMFKEIDIYLNKKDTLIIRNVLQWTARVRWNWGKHRTGCFPKNYGGNRQRRERDGSNKSTNASETTATWETKKDPTGTTLQDNM